MVAVLRYAFGFAMIFLAVILALAGSCMIGMHAVNATLSRLHRIGQPPTFSNMLTIASLEERYRIDQAQKFLLTDERAVVIELHGRHIFDDIRRRVAGGASWEDASRAVLIRRD